MVVGNEIAKMTKHLYHISQFLGLLESSSLKSISYAGLFVVVVARETPVVGLLRAAPQSLET